MSFIPNGVDFDGVVIVIEKCELACLQYYLNGQEHKLKSRVLHGNARQKSSQKQHLRTKTSVLEKTKKLSLLPKEAMLVIIKNGGGIDK